MPHDPTHLSRFLSFVLRHRPQSIGLALDEHGWTSIDELVQRAAAHGRRFEREDVLHVAATSDKKRFTISPDGRRIRAAQGHSIEVDLELVPREPPPVLFHGTTRRFLDAISRQGLTRQERQHVHLSADIATARSVGARRGTPTVFSIDARAMHAAGSVFYRAENGVWLTKAVPVEFLTQVIE